MSATEARRWVAENGGTVIEGRPITAPGQARLWVRCAAGHEWCPPIKRLAKHHWCRPCYGNAPLSIELMQETAAERGGKCISAVYVNTAALLTWECAIGHRWAAAPNNVRGKGSWCPTCRINVGEEISREILKEAFPGETFDRTRLEPWMEGRELDGYSPRRRLAFEYQGVQHYRRVPHFHRNEGDFEAQVERDFFKVTKCDEEWVTLLIIPYTIKKDELRTFIRDFLEEVGYDIAPISVPMKDIYARIRAHNTQTDQQYSKALAVIQAKGGTCLSTHYISYRTKLEIRCGKGHVFFASLEAIDQPTYRGPRFCNECSGRRRWTDARLRDVLEARGYTFIRSRMSTELSRQRPLVDLICPHGHEMKGTHRDNVTRTNRPGNGCLECANIARGDAHRNSIELWCKEMGITPLMKYTRATETILWRCTNDHVFAAQLHVLQDKQAPIKPCIECDLARIEETYNLQLLTTWTRYCGSTTALQWKCLTCDNEFMAAKTGLTARNKICKKCHADINLAKLIA